MPGRTKHLQDNNEFRFWAQRQQRTAESVLQGDMIEDLWGFNWHFIGGTYQDSSGATHDLIPQTSAVICPQTGPWLAASRGLELVPQDLSPAPGWREAIAQLAEVYGQFGYAVLEHNPAQLSLFLGENWGLNFPDPNAIWMPTCFDDSGESGTGN